MDTHIEIKTGDTVFITETLLNPLDGHTCHGGYILVRGDECTIIGPYDKYDNKEEFTVKLLKNSKIIAYSKLLYRKKQIEIISTWKLSDGQVKINDEVVILKEIKGMIHEIKVTYSMSILFYFFFYFLCNVFLAENGKKRH